MNFLKTTLIGGALFLVPLVAITVVAVKAYGFMLKIADPIANIIPIDYFGGIALANLLAVGAVVLLCFLAGLLAKTPKAKAFADKAENTIMKRIPGYTFFKGFTSALDPGATEDLKPVIVSLHKFYRLGLAVENIGDDKVAVYFPGSPNAWSGIVLVVPIEQTKPIDIPIMSVIEHAEQLGRGTNELLVASGVKSTDWGQTPD
ncbi:MAG: DUF502 domain-containing protein [Gammaproteobacteria bacterium]